MQTNLIDPTSFDKQHALSVGLRLVGRHWFLAYSKLMAMEWRWDSGFPYGATDGRTLLLNPKGIDKLAALPNGAGLIAFLLVHEALHALLGHGWRTEGMRDKRTANVAADYIINAMIANRNRELRATNPLVRHDVFPFIEGVLLDENLSGDKAVEQLYRELCQPDPQPQPQPQPDPNQQQDQSDNDPDDSDDGDAGDDAEEGDDPADCGGEADDGEGEPDDGDGGGSSDVAGDSGDDSDMDGDGTGAGGDTGDDAGAGDGGDPTDLSDFVGTGAEDNFKPEVKDGETEEQAVDTVEEVNDRILIADTIDRHTQGTTGATGTRVADQRKRGDALPWVDLMHEWLNKRSAMGWEAPFNAPIFSSVRLACAGRRSRSAGEIVMVLDTSGSIGQATYNRFLIETQEVLDTLKPEGLHLVSVSHRVCDSVRLETGDTVPDRLKGGGGTAFKPAFDWVRDNGIDVDVMVYLTDGISSDLPTLTEPEFPVLWLSTVTPEKSYPFGDVVMVKNF